MEMENISLKFGKVRRVKINRHLLVYIRAKLLAKMHFEPNFEIVSDNIYFNKAKRKFPTIKR